ncbi:glutamate cyclase domain-containing protein [uncultured Propionivibrio sp.]|uniref:glutamate cyclase domain-containing protein n=1 Tax=uncultured Propionivibrio sp. TaxID=426737 RepID=UPI0029C0D788|nr:glutamate cyclase domain-containing protein [uncultured Propionivibrio sp.]
MSSSANIINRIAALAAHDAGRRGFSNSALAQSGLFPAAESLLSGERTIIATGFCIRAAMIGENDGPPGALAIADALCQLGQEVVFVSDHFSSGLLEAGMRAYDMRLPVTLLERDQATADREISALLADFRPTHVVAIERPGSAIDGHRYSMRGAVLDDLVPAADALLAPGEATVTIAIGDGGNELGMGGLRADHHHRVMYGEKIFCATRADFVIPAGISNWGGHALAAALGILAGRRLMRTPEHERRVLEALQAAGAVDGCTGKADLSVDGIAWEDYAETLRALHAAGRGSLT